MGGSAFAQQTDGRMHSGCDHRFGFAKHAATLAVGWIRCRFGGNGVNGESGGGIVVKIVDGMQ